MSNTSVTHTSEIVEGDAGGNNYFIRGASVPTRGGLSLKTGQMATVQWRDGLPVMILEYEFRRGTAVDAPTGMTPLVEELFVDDAAAGSRDVWLRNYGQVTKLDVRSQLPADPTSVTWGERDDSFFVTLFVAGAVRYYVFMLNRVAGRPYPAGKKATATLIRHDQPSALTTLVPTISVLRPGGMLAPFTNGTTHAIALTVADAFTPGGFDVVVSGTTYHVVAGLVAPTLDAELDVIVGVSLNVSTAQNGSFAPWQQFQFIVVNATTGAILHQSYAGTLNFIVGATTALVHFWVKTVNHVTTVRAVLTGVTDLTANVLVTAVDFVGPPFIPAGTQDQNPVVPTPHVFFTQAGGTRFTLVKLAESLALLAGSTSVELNGGHVHIHIGTFEEDVPTYTTTAVPFTLRLVDASQHHALYSIETNDIANTVVDVRLVGVDAIAAGVLDRSKFGPVAVIGADLEKVLTEEVRTVGADFVYAAVETRLYFVQGWKRLDGAIVLSEADPAFPKKFTQLDPVRMLKKLPDDVTMRPVANYLVNRVFPRVYTLHVVSDTTVLVTLGQAVTIKKGT